MLVEELLLMVSTVFMAIWGLTSKSYRSAFRLVDERNALPVGLAFGYAYAGSVAMLTNVLNDIRYVMISGHVVVILTFFWMQRRVLASVLEDHDATVEIRREVNDTGPQSDSDDSVGGDTEQISDVENEENVVETEVSTEIAVDDQWEENTTKAIGQDVDWSPDEIIDLVDD